MPDRRRPIQPCRPRRQVLVRNHETACSEQHSEVVLEYWAPADPETVCGLTTMGVTRTLFRADLPLKRIVTRV